MPKNLQCDFFKEFVCGDLIYGTEVDRKDYYALAEKKSTVYTIDKLTSEMDFALRGFNDSVCQKLTPEAFLKLPQPAQSFLLYAQKVKQWDKMKGIGITDYTKTGVLKGMPSMKGAKMSVPYFRAKCKAGIGFVLDSCSIRASRSASSSIR